MTRILPLAAGLMVTASVAAVIATGSGASAAQKPAKAPTFKQVLASKLGAQLNKPADDVLAALKGAAKARRTVLKGTAKAQRPARIKGKKWSPSQVRAAREAWAAAVAKPLGLDAARVTAALRALITQRLDSLVSDGWLTAAQRDEKLACFDGAASCRRGAGPGVGFLRPR